jgi:hypothetical protein
MPSEPQKYIVQTDFRGSPDGINTVDYRKGQVVTYPDDMSLVLARAAVRNEKITRLFPPSAPVLQ